MGRSHLFMSGSRNCVLSIPVIDRIAAGEVVERLALGIKQLCENIADACASSIRVDIESGGPERIPVCVDGIGLSETAATVPQSRPSTSRSPRVWAQGYGPHGS
jgi:DNA mismatch repair protein MutL